VNFVRRKKLSNFTLNSKNYRRRNGVLSREDSIAALEPRICKECGTKFQPTTHINDYCEVECRDAAALRTNRTKTVYEKFLQKLKWNHKLSIEQYHTMLDAGCSMCGEPFGQEKRLSPCIDHDHNCCPEGKSCSKCRRGLIHNKCNLLLGHAEDSVGILAKAISYLTRKP